MVDYVLIIPISFLLTVSAQYDYIRGIRFGNEGHQFNQPVLKIKYALSSLPDTSLAIRRDLGLGTWFQQ